MSTVSETVNVQDCIHWGHPTSVCKTGGVSKTGNFGIHFPKTGKPVRFRFFLKKA